MTDRSKQEELIQLRMESQQKFPKDYLEQLRYITNNASDSYTKLLGVAEIMQHAGSHGFEAKVTMKALELYNRAIIDIVEHTENKLDDGIYNHNYYNIRNVSEEILKQGSNPN